MRAFTIALAALLGASGVCHAAEIKVISANGMREVIAETKAGFEASTGHRLTVTVVETGEIRRRVLGGERFDVIMVPRVTSDELERAGKIVPGSAVALIRVNFGLAVASDGPRPDVNTPEELKRALLGAKTVLITDPKTGGISGVHFMDVLDKLGITKEMQDKLVPATGAQFHALRVVRGEADIAVQAEHEIRCTRGATFLPYPAQFQQVVVFMGSVSTANTNQDAAKSYLAYVTGPNAATAIKAHCLTPG